MTSTQDIPAVSPTPASSWSSALRLALLMSLVLGLAYPLLVTTLAGRLFPHQATGSLLTGPQGQVVGSALVGQRFEGEGYFIGRPSAANYQPFAVGGSNLAPSNPELRSRAQQTAARLAAREGVAPGAIPVDLLAASGSGIDPHISLEAARLQLPRVAAARGLAEGEVAALIDAATEHGAIIGRPVVNVLRLNLALDRRGHSPLPGG